MHCSHPPETTIGRPSLVGEKSRRKEFGPDNRKNEIRYQAARHQPVGHERELIDLGLSIPDQTMASVEVLENLYVKTGRRAGMGKVVPCQGGDDEPTVAL